MTEMKETSAATTRRTVAVLGGQVLRVECEGQPADYLHAILPVREVVAASHIRVDLTFAPFAPVFDYLAEASEARA